MLNLRNLSNIFLSVLCVAILFLPSACKKGGSDSSGKNGKAGQTMPEQSPENLATLVAQVNDYKITVGDLQAQINKQAPHVRARFTSHEQKKEFARRKQDAGSRFCDRINTAKIRNIGEKEKKI